jgi:phosphoglycolate phosphatase
MMWEAMAEAGVEPDSTAMVGDTTFDIEMARAAGADPVGVSWGYHPPPALMNAGARLVLPDFAALPGCLTWSATPAPVLAKRA